MKKWSVILLPDIVDGLCDYPDLCRKKDCPFFSDDVESVRRYIMMRGEEFAYPWKKYPRQKSPVGCPLTTWRLSLIHI